VVTRFELQRTEIAQNGGDSEQQFSARSVMHVNYTQETWLSLKDHDTMRYHLQL